MTVGRTRILALIVLCVQAIAAVAFARGEVICQDVSTGHSQRESVAEQMLCDRCHGEPIAVSDSHGTAVIEAAACVDTPVGGLDAAQPRGRNVDAAAFGPAPAALPAFVTPSLRPFVALRADDFLIAAAPPRRCVRTVVLVI